MADTAKRLVGPTQLAAATATLYTVPAGTTTIVRHIHVLNTTGGAVTFILGIGTDAAGTRLLDTESVAAKPGKFEWRGFLVLAAGELLKGHASAATSLTITVSGVEVV